MTIRPGDLVYVFKRGPAIFISEENHSAAVLDGEEKIVVKYCKIVSKLGVETVQINHASKIPE